MIIREFLIDLYGPVRNRRCRLAPGFNLLYGDNETGKTLTVDALVKLLLGRQAREKEFAALERVEQFPEGYVILEAKPGETIKLPESGDLSKVAGLSPAECANIFIIRNSNLAIAREREFYADLTDRLTGLRTAEIAAIIGKLYEMAALTPTGQFRNSGEVKLKSRLEEAGELASHIEELHRALLAEGFPALEKEQLDLAEELAAIEERLEAFERARQRERYEKGKQALEQLQEAEARLQALQQINDDDERAWAEAERDRRRLKEEYAGLKAGLKEKEQELNALKRQWQEKRLAFEEVEERKTLIDEEIRPALKNYLVLKGDVMRREGHGRFLAATAAFAAVLLIVAVAGAILRPEPFFFTAAAVAALVALLSWLAAYRVKRDRGVAAAALENIMTKLARHGLEGEGEGAVHRAVQACTAEYDRLQAELNRMKGEIEALKRELAALRDFTMPLRARELSVAARAIGEIKERSGLGSLVEYSARLKEKREAGAEITACRSVLESLFSSPPAAGDPAGETPLKFWEEAVAALASFVGESPGLHYDDQTVAQLKERKQAVEEKMAAGGYRIAAVERELQEIERQANLILQSEADPLYCRSASDLPLIRGRLIAFVEAHRQMKEEAQQVISIFEAIAAEEKARVAELFGAGSPVSGYFRQITGGLYETVFYDRAGERIKVRRRDGAILSADKLSGGAYDQLYLSIRLTLAEKLLAGGGGFMIMDDPFIKSDRSRLKQQLTALLSIAAAGRQIIYITAKEEVRQLLRPEIEAGRVKAVEFMPILP
jgi:DNA repair exonuclease SbcCD ATPase subunit